MLRGIDSAAANATETMRRAHQGGIPVVFWLRNCAYRARGLFDLVDAALVPSRYSAAYYRNTLGLDCTVIPSPLNWSRVRCDRAEGQQYVTFVNPQPAKGVFVFARIAHELARQRPDIPLLVVEGRATANWLKRTGIDFGATANLHVMANTPDPRDFYRVSRVVLVPSLCQDTFPRVAVEALCNGIPVLGSPRGGLPEVLREAGFLLDIPERYTPRTRRAPTPEQVAPWVQTVIRLWDDAAFYQQESRRCVAAAEVWRPERLAEQYDVFFRRCLPSRPSDEGNHSTHRSSGSRYNVS